MRIGRIAGFGILSVLVAGCYTLQPVTGGPPDAGARVAFDINDVGRVALGGTVGPEIAQIEGQLLNGDNGEYLVAVSTIRLLRGGEQVWSGERVRIRPEYTGTAYERRFSRGRTIALSATIIGGVVAVVVGRDLLGLGSGEKSRPPTDTAQTRIGRP